MITLILERVMLVILYLIINIKVISFASAVCRSTIHDYGFYALLCLDEFFVFRVVVVVYFPLHDLELFHIFLLYLLTSQILRYVILYSKFFLLTQLSLLVIALLCIVNLYALFSPLILLCNPRA